MKNSNPIDQVWGFLHLRWT